MLSIFSSAQNKIEIKNWLKTNPIKVFKPVFDKNENIEGKTFTDADLLKNFRVDFKNKRPQQGRSILIENKTLSWNTYSIPNDSLIALGLEGQNIFFIATYIQANRWLKAKLKINSNALFELYVDHQLKTSKDNNTLNENTTDLKLIAGKHLLVFKIMSNQDSIKLNAYLEYEENYTVSDLSLSMKPNRKVTINDILDGLKISSAKISPSGNYLLLSYKEIIRGMGKNKSYTVLKNLKSNQNLFVFRNPGIKQMKWLPKTDRISYTSSFEKATDLYLYDILKAEEKVIVKNIKNFSSYKWSPTEKFIIYTEYIPFEKKEKLKHIYGNDDRLPYYRSRSFLHKIDISSGTINQLTWGSLSSSLHDIHPSGNKILFSTSKMDYSEVPFRKQNLYELSINTFELDTIWNNKRYGGSCDYSPDGTKLLVQGGPECFDEIGKNISKAKIPNSYDSQLYLFDLKSKNATALTYQFDPSVNSTYWAKNNELYIFVTEKDYKNLYHYSFKNKRFLKITLKTEVLSDIDYSHHQPLAVYKGTSITTPDQLFLLDLKKNKSSQIAFPEKDRFSQVDFGKTKEWSFVNKNNTTIYGRVYYPPNFDESKKYPVIVYYYGGTSPVQRNFGGRYPKNVWAAGDYIIYVLQPSGATGFGQEFSALHVNGWGFDAIDDIIDGTKKFLAAHPNADIKNVGCIGASYGGYTTMLLQTRTDIFKTAVSHAGISSITSYWGEGFWGYSYSAVATTNSYPWNRKDIYVENSPVYNADKFQNSILLLHGTDDTNVPVGESLQYYAALKILGKDVEMVLINGQNHWIVDYEKRLKWHYTIMSWFDKKLKNQPEHWNNLYPEKNY